MGKKRRVEEESSEGAPEWMTTYSDLVTLLLTFFILLFSMAVIDKQKFNTVAESLRSSFMRLSNGELYNQNKGKELISLLEFNNESEEFKEQLEKEAENAKKIESLKSNIDKIIKELGMVEHIKVIEEQTHIILRVDSIILFNSGSADIKQSGKDVLKKLAPMLVKLENEILIQGHTDNLPIDTLLFPSNWELSTKRATNVVVFFIESCSMNPKYLTATGNAEFKPIAPNDTEQNRQKNRRIDIFIKK